MLIWGLFLGLPVGFLLSLCFSQRGFPLTLLRTRFARIQDSSSFDLHFMFKELQQKLEDLAGEIARVDLELQHLQVKIHAMEEKQSFWAPSGRSSGGPPDPQNGVCSSAKNCLPAIGRPLKVLQYRQEIFRLYRDGLSLQEIARQLKIRQGEVELVLSLKEYKE